MKKILTTGLCLALASIGGAEVIQSVNFNPARFGQYERLKVSEQANFKGGLKAKSMQVQSAGTIDLNATPSTGQVNLAYLITKLDGTLGHSHVGDDFPSTPTLVFPATCFSSREHCVETTSVGLLQVAFMNGAARFQAPSSYTTAPESRIKQITTPSDRLRLDAVYANIHGKLKVSGNEGYTFRKISPKTPLRLAGNWIPLPSASGAPTGGTLEWQTRKTVKYASKGGGNTVRVLALKGKKSVSCNKTCRDGNCPGGYTGKITYRLNTTTCSCEVASNTCKPNETYRWIATSNGNIPACVNCGLSVDNCRRGRTPNGSTITTIPGYNVPCSSTTCNASTLNTFCTDVSVSQAPNYHETWQSCFYHQFACEKK
ncbi:hypothetical protein [Candidatus Avelusimicrobium faecicola]|uniref:hypothetical protein n=1 Tax=Candidatus Avelusimicrobium faecicola TaxID=3416205 RepID=UPI00159FE456